jgi:hypothetical protein
MIALEEFAATNEVLRSLLPPADTPGPVLRSVKLDYEGAARSSPISSFKGPAVLAAGLSVCVEGRWLVYSGPVAKQDLEEIEVEMLRYLRSFC